MREFNRIIQQSKKWTDRPENESEFIHRVVSVFNSNVHARREKDHSVRSANPQFFRDKNRASYHRHAARRAADARAQRLEVKKDPARLARYRAWCCNNVKRRKAKDPQFKIRFLMRNRIWMAMQRGIAKAGNTVDLVGCSMADYKAHIESKWIPGMSWSNYGRGKGKWHIDHIKPCASFDLTQPDQQKLCFHFSNTQPLWAFDNLSKGAKV